MPKLKIKTILITLSAIALLYLYQNTITKASDTYRESILKLENGLEIKNHYTPQNSNKKIKLTIEYGFINDIMNGNKPYSLAVINELNERLAKQNGVKRYDLAVNHTNTLLDIELHTTANIEDISTLLNNLMQATTVNIPTSAAQISNYARPPIEPNLWQKLSSKAIGKHALTYYPKPGDLNKLTVAELSQTYHNHIQPSNIRALFYGDITADNLAKLSQRLSQKHSAAPAVIYRATLERQDSYWAEYIKGLPQTRYIFCYYLPGTNSKDMAALTAITALIDHPTHSKLYQELVEEKKLVSKLTASYLPYPSQTLLIVDMQVNRDREIEQIKDIFTAHIAKLSSEAHRLEKIAETIALEEKLNGYSLGNLQAMHTYGVTSSKIRNLTASDLENIVQEHLQASFRFLFLPQ